MAYMLTASLVTAEQLRLDGNMEASYRITKDSFIMSMSMMINSTTPPVILPLLQIIMLCAEMFEQNGNKNDAQTIHINIVKYHINMLQNSQPNANANTNTNANANTNTNANGNGVS